jgi:predicted RNA binding protein YcfA (HicA-like mRNA interferase family)
MSRLPRDITGEHLACLLKMFGDELTRQTGSHLRLTTVDHGEHHITIPRHNPLRVGTLNAILVGVASHFKITREELLNKLL